MNSYFSGRWSYDKNINKTLYVSNGGGWGDWGDTEFCPKGTYAIGYNMKIEPYLGKGKDDTMLNAVRLLCADVDGNRRGGTVTSSVGRWGDWQLWKDDTAANYMKIKCRDYVGGSSVETVKSPGSGKFGDWGSWSESCPSYSAVCGIKTRLEEAQGHNDDTALNDVHLFCCTEGRTVSDPFG